MGIWTCPLYTSPPSQGRRPWWLPPPPRSAQRANRSTNRAGIERNCWPVGPAHVVVGPARPAGPGWENGWPLGPPDACCPAARATTDPGRGPRGSPGVERSEHARVSTLTRRAPRRRCQRSRLNRTNPYEASPPPGRRHSRRLLMWRNTSTMTNSWRPPDRQNWRFVATARPKSRAVSQTNPRPPNP